MELAMSFHGRSERKILKPLETVRVALLYNGKVLLLRKSKDSKMPLSFEFPGGKIDGVKRGEKSTATQQISSVIKEVQEEANIDISKREIIPVETFNKRYETISGSKITTLHKGIVHLFLVEVSAEDIANIKVGQTLNAEGKSEDHHDSYGWASLEDLKTLLEVRRNPLSGKNIRSLSRSSRHLSKLFMKIDEKLKKTEAPD